MDISDIEIYRKYFIVSLIAYILSGVIFAFIPDRDIQSAIVVLIGMIVTYRYYKLHLAMYNNFKMTCIMTVIMFIFTCSFWGIVGLIISIYTIVKANSIIKSQSN